MLQESLIFFPEKLAGDFKYEFNHRHEELFIESTTGNSLNCLLFKTEQPKGVIIYFHGNAGSLRSWGSVSDNFLPYQYDFFIIDYPGYGKSKGNISEENLFKDAQSVYDEMRKKYDENKIVVYGRSLGSGIAACLGSQNNPKAVILESPYFSMVDLAKNLYPFLPSFLLKYPFRTDLLFSKIKCPVYLIHGTDDEVVYFESSQKLKKLFKNTDELFVIEGGHHNDLDDFTEFHSSLKSILN